MKRPKKSLFRVRWLIFFVLLLLPMFYLGRRAYRLFNSVEEERNLKKTILVLEAEQEALKNRIREYRKGNLLEAKARNDLGMIKPNEKIYVIGK